MLHVGDTVYKIYPYDGTKKAGTKRGKPLTITAIRDHNPGDGASRKLCIADLSNGEWEFIWNLIPQNPPAPVTSEAKPAK